LGWHSSINLRFFPACTVKRSLIPGVGRAGSLQLKSANWIEVVPAVGLPEMFLAAELGVGENQVIAVALHRKAQLVLLDELKARRIASQVYGLRVKGSAGILIQAKRAGVISAVRPLFEAMKQKGYYLSPRLIGMACREAGESAAN
jgi:predicted nucleic acid-binding protein